MALAQILLDILVCPETKLPLSQLHSDKLNYLNTLIKAGKIKNRDGRVISEAVDCALIREDGKFAYPVRNDIPIMLVNEGLVLDSSML